MIKLEDTYRHKGLRKQLVALLREKGIKDERVLEAIYALPRHHFLDAAFMETAYEDKAFQIGQGQTISQPYTVAYQTELLQIQKREKVLEIGTGSGYQACILSIMGARVYTIERQKKLHEKTTALIEALNLPNIRQFYGDGFEGKPPYAPFDKILITAAAPEIPPKLLEQLKVGGIMVIPYGEGVNQVMLRLTKTTARDIETEEFADFKFVPMLKGVAR
ncbi:protein-L-isoaspartate(D-aspartate) O-methyltransferase [soil metagenome]